MKTSYEDILAVAENPLWYDSEGVPRYAPFRKSMNGILFRAIALMTIACQKCGKRFTVAKGREKYTVYGLQKRLERVEILADTSREQHVLIRPRDLLETLRPQPDDIPLIKRPTLGDVAYFYYGDPPVHGCIGDTMGSIHLRVLEYWEQNTTITDGSIKDKYGNAIGGKIVAGNYDWVRHPAHEVDVRNDYARKNFTF